MWSICAYVNFQYSLLDGNSIPQELICVKYEMQTV